MILKLTEENKKYILNEHLRNVSHIANKEYQKRVWIRGEGPEVDDFDDTVNDFMVVCDSILENYGDFKVTENQYKILKNFSTQFKSFSDKNYWPPEFIDTPEWGKIIEMAKELLKAFNYKKVDKQ